MGLKKNITIIHYQPIEKYPPILNIINKLSNSELFITTIYTTNNNNNWFKSVNKNTILKRYSLRNNKILIYRYLNYLIYNLSTFFNLIYTKPKIIIYYETFSVFPVFLYKIFYREVNIFVHFHEYVSKSEKNQASLYFKFLLFIESKILKKVCWVSHTNIERLNMFHNDYKFLKYNVLNTYPNYPPENWKDIKYAKSIKINIISFVYVGSLSFETMYLKEFINWISLNPKTYNLDIYTSSNIKQFLNNYLLYENITNVKIYDEVNYFDLPKFLINYDYGLVLYKGHIPNYIYNVPNKVYEYLSCGLNVLYSNKLISINNFKKINNINNIIEFDFDNPSFIPLTNSNYKEFYSFSDNLYFQKFLKNIQR